MAKVAPLSKGEVFGGGRLMNASGIASMGSGGGGGRIVNQPVGRKSNEVLFFKEINKKIRTILCQFFFFF